MRVVFGTFVLTAVVSLLATPIFRRLALRWGLVDQPDGHRKLHQSRTPVSGGVPVFLTALIGVCIALIVPNRWRETLLADPQFLLGMLISSTIIVLVGLIDDWRGLRGRQKLLGQCIAAATLIAFGLRIENIVLFDYRISLEMQLGDLILDMSIPFTMFWLLGAINAFNLIDGVDGLAASLGMIICLGLAGMAGLYGHGAHAVFAVALAGGLAGFLVYNFPPARIFLGDSGSMLIGLVLATIAIKCSLKGPATAALVVPTAIMTIPIFDVVMAILRRKLTGKSLYETDRGHLHHCLMARGVSGPKLLLSVGVLCGIAGVGALFSIHRKNDFLAIASAGLVVLILVVTRSFGHTELAMLARKMRRLAVSLVPGSRLKDSGVQPVANHLQGHREWNTLWEMLTDFAERFDIDSVELNVSMPSVGEEYHAKWSRKERVDDKPAWRSDIPLVFDDTAAGRLRVVGAPGSGSICTWMGELISGLKPFESQMLELVRAEKRSVEEVRADETATPTRLKVG